jgi:integrase
MNLTDRFVAAAKSPDKPQTDYFDDVVRGRSLRVTSAGRKTWTLTYTRPSNGKRARISLGTYPELGVARARQKAIERKAAVGDGADPAAAMTAQRSAMRVRDLAEIFLHQHAGSLRSGWQVKRRIEKNVIPVIGDVKLSGLHKRDVTRAVDKVLDRGCATEANRVFEDARAMVRWGVAKGYLDTSPVEGMKRPARLQSRERVLSPEEIAQLWERLPSIPASEGFRNIIRLCLITVQRVGEVAGMRRDELDLQKRLWSLPRERTKNAQPHTVPLSDFALAVLREALKSSENSPFVFPSVMREPGPITSHSARIPQMSSASSGTQGEISL